MSDQQLDPRADLKARVKEILTEFVEDSDKLVDKLINAGSGVLEAHEQNLENCPWIEPRKVVLALAEELRHQQQPPDRLNTKQFKADVKNYYTLL
jgi:uncharacterized lipoprotein YddW (UPF0748 family)